MFTVEWRRLKLKDEDLQTLERKLLENPEAGDVMAGTGGLRKFRFAPPSLHRGKSGATRVCYAWYPEHQRIYLVMLYAKNDKGNLTSSERNEVRELLQRLSGSLSRGENP